jgi:hypothetical protein
MYRWTGDAAFRRAAEKLVRFLTTYVHPDGTSIGAFDVRNGSVMAYFPNCPGLEFTPEGRAFSARAFALWQDLGMADNPLCMAVCTRDLPRVAFYAADTCRYYRHHAPEPAQIVDSRGRLPVDRDGVLENHTRNFDGLLVRRGSWVVALSSQSPEGPRTTKSPYMLDGQSRMDIWHEKGRLMVGGGHNHRTWPIPFANVFLATDQAGDSAFGKPDARLDREARLACFLPEEASTRMQDTVPELLLRFSQGTVRFRFAFPDGSRMEITAEWTMQQVRRLCLQLPLVVWRGSELLLDGTRQTSENALREVRRDVRIQGGRFAAPMSVRVPETIACRVHFPLTTGQFHDEPWQEDPVRNPFDLALLSSQWSPPEKTGRANWFITVG